MGETTFVDHLRTVGMKVPELALRMETKDSFGGFAKSLERMKQGIGTLFVFTHNSLADGMAVITFARKNLAIANRELIMPMSKKLFEDRGYRHMQGPLGVKFFPIETPEFRAENNDDGRRGVGLISYLRAARGAIEHGNMVAIAPQAQGNMGVLDTRNPTQAFSAFTRFMEGAKPQVDYSILPLGIYYPKSIARHVPQSGAHTLEPMTLSIGKCFSAQDMIAEVQQTGGNRDAWIYDQMASLLPQEIVVRK